MGSAGGLVWIGLRSASALPFGKTTARRRAGAWADGSKNAKSGG